MMKTLKNIQWNNPAAIYKILQERAAELILKESEKANLDIVIDYHYFFLHSSVHKNNFSFRHQYGNWKYDAESFENLFDMASKLIPYVASGKLPVVKFTNMANVFTGEKQLVVYSFPSGPAPPEVGEIVKREISEKIYWNSSWYQMPDMS
jgi:hypothetical protein